MVLNDERGEQTQRKWLSRSAKERRDLSASVEETLGDPTLDEERDLQEISQYGSSIRDARGEAVFPPRLSLQSRPMPAVYPGSFVDAARRSQAATAATATEEGEGQKADTATQNANLLRRFAQRLTSSLAAFGSTMHFEAIPPLPPPTQEESQQAARVQDGGSSVKHESIAVAREQTAPPADYSGPLVRVLDTTSPTRSSMGSAGLSQSKQRLAGRTSRIRLETAPIPATPRPKPGEQQANPPLAEQAPVAQPVEGISADSLRAGQGGTSTHLPVVEASHTELGTTSTHLPSVSIADSDTGAMPALPSPVELPSEESNPISSARFPAVDTPHEEAARSSLPLPETSQEEASEGDALRDELKQASKHIPIMDVIKGQVTASSRGALSGSGVFASGQRDVIVSNPNVTQSSVVLITLTANPGPVVVQYVSLQPQKGFTAHLTAPATVETPFNYVVLLGELF